MHCNKNKTFYIMANELDLNEMNGAWTTKYQN